MPGRRRWAPIVVQNASQDRFDVGNGHYTSARAQLDRNVGTSRFVAAAEIDSWREEMRHDEAVRAVLLNQD